MKFFTIMLFFGFFTAFASENYKDFSLTLKNAKNQSEISEQILDAYLNKQMLAEEECEEIDTYIEKSKKVFQENLDVLFKNAESYDKEMLRLVGNELNAWKQFKTAIDLPYNDENMIKVINASTELFLISEKVYLALENGYSSISEEEKLKKASVSIEN